MKRSRRFFSGCLAAVFSAFLTYTFLEPLFVPVDSEVAMGFLYILAINAFVVGMSLGVLLPVLFPGVCFGGSLALLVGAFAGVANPVYLPAVGGAAAVVFGVLSARYVFSLLRDGGFLLSLFAKQLFSFRLSLPSSHHITAPGSIRSFSLAGPRAWRAEPSRRASSSSRCSPS